MVKEGYRNTSIGVIPNDWKVERLSDVGKVTGGNTPRRSTDEYWGGDIPWLTPSQLTGKLINEISETDEYITEKGFENSSVKLLPPGTVIMSSRATIGETVINKVPLTTNQGFANIICDENKVYNYYLLYLLRYITPRLEALAGGSTFLEISRTNVRSVNIPVPPLSEQKRIASILSSVDKSIEKTDEVIEETKELKKGLMQELLTKGIGHSEFKDSQFGEIPKSWEIKQVKNTGKVITGSTPRTADEENYGGYKLLVGPGDLTDNKYIYNSEKKLSEIGFEKTRKLPKGSILITCIGATIGKMGIAGIELSTNQQINSIICNNKYDNEFVYYCLNKNFRIYKSYISNQAVPIMNKTTFSNLSLPVPSLEEQKKIASILLTVDTKIKKEKEYKAKLERLKKGLMQKLLTGEIRVNTDMEV
ncbi:type I restriction enzyme S subunit [Halanaerobium saccharolyticum]|uniref:Type I restriction enzyme S subunit n=1 Tax=Halanaerobium saccharolyticum TaxID=43595 RepID=A0A4R7Z4J2_9FIRM|nr:restriction endonuclease subunit S [Halanaerobium saccharolyticum]RAK10296.1 type I restriction enzyme S subunit [Halanaerobium saccharolyticum]TDW05242.1 type I restriction enzyme S subunit [Halanaerobium saccharolyticum]TDX60312.1 type I restriction enzyme S subunit [Halanaerobium saccharolyticum]